MSARRGRIISEESRLRSRSRKRHRRAVEVRRNAAAKGVDLRTLCGLTRKPCEALTCLRARRGAGGESYGPTAGRAEPKGFEKNIPEAVLAHGPLGGRPLPNQPSVCVFSELRAAHQMPYR